MTERLDVVYNRRAHIKPEHCRKIGWFDAGVGAFAFKRFDQARFLAANVGARAAMNVNFSVKSGPENILAEKILCSSEPG
jgi:hypothetical protein